MLDGDDMSLYRDCGYRCIDKEVGVDKNTRDYIYELKNIDKMELEATASYFENFKYCVEFKPSEFGRISGLLKKVNAIEKAAKKRELLTESISKNTRDKVYYAFMGKIERLNTEFRNI